MRRTIVIDGTQCGNLKEFFTHVKEPLQFPEYFGNNLDAFEECIQEILVPLRIEWNASEQSRLDIPEFGDLCEIIKSNPLIDLTFS